MIPLRVLPRIKVLKQRLKIHFVNYLRIEFMVWKLAFNVHAVLRFIVIDSPIKIVSTASKHCNEMNIGHR